MSAAVLSHTRFSDSYIPDFFTYMQNLYTFSIIAPALSLYLHTNLAILLTEVALHVSSIGPTIESMTSRRQIRPHFRVNDVTTSDPRWRPPRLPIQDGGPHDTKMAAPTTSDPRWRPPRLPIQDGGPHDTKMAAPTKSDTRWRSL